MRNIKINQIFFLILLLGLPGCEIIGGIFKAGFWVGIIVVVLIIVLIAWIIKKTRH